MNPTSATDESTLAVVQSCYSMLNHDFTEGGTGTHTRA